MTDQNNAAQAAEQDPLSDEYVNALTRQHGYGHPVAVAARLWKWIGLHGGENSVTLLMYEAHKALSKLRAEGVQAGDERAADTAQKERERGYAENAAFRIWWDENQACPEHSLTTENAAHAAWQERGRRAALASAPVAGEAQPTDEQIHRLAFDAGVVFGNTEEGAECWEFESPSLREFALALLSRHGAPQASEAPKQPTCNIGHANFTPFYLLANLRRIGGPSMAKRENWVLASDLFAVGSTTARRLCREAGIDPDGKTVTRAALPAQPAAEPATSQPSPAAGAALSGAYCVRLK